MYSLSIFTLSGPAQDQEVAADGEVVRVPGRRVAHRKTGGAVAPLPQAEQNRTYGYYLTENLQGFMPLFTLKHEAHFHFLIA